MPKKGVIKKDGRPPGTGRYKEETVPIRVPLALVGHVKDFLNRYVEVIEESENINEYRKEISKNCWRIIFEKTYQS